VAGYVMRIYLRNSDGHEFGVARNIAKAAGW